MKLKPDRYAWPKKQPDQQALRLAIQQHMRPKPPREIWITVGADCPWNTTPGVRQVHCFHSIEEAEAAGFTGIK